MDRCIKSVIDRIPYPLTVSRYSIRDWLDHGQVGIGRHSHTAAATRATEIGYLRSVTVVIRSQRSKCSPLFLLHLFCVRPVVKISLSMGQQSKFNCELKVYISSLQRHEHVRSGSPWSARRGRRGRHPGRRRTGNGSSFIIINPESGFYLLIPGPLHVCFFKIVRSIRTVF